MRNSPKFVKTGDRVNSSTFPLSTYGRPGCPASCSFYNQCGLQIFFRQRRSAANDVPVTRRRQTPLDSSSEPARRTFPVQTSVAHTRVNNTVISGKIYDVYVALSDRNSSGICTSGPTINLPAKPATVEHTGYRSVCVKV